MAKYRAKQKITVDAEQFISESSMWPAGVIELAPRDEDSDSPVRVFQFAPLESPCAVHEGDWIVWGPGGKASVIDSADFFTTYEPVEGEHNVDA